MSVSVLFLAGTSRYMYPVYRCSARELKEGLPAKALRGQIGWLTVTDPFTDLSNHTKQIPLFSLTYSTLLDPWTKVKDPPAKALLRHTSLRQRDRLELSHPRSNTISRSPWARREYEDNDAEYFTYNCCALFRNAAEPSLGDRYEAVGSNCDRALIFVLGQIPRSAATSAYQCTMSRGPWHTLCRSYRNLLRTVSPRH